MFNREAIIHAWCVRQLAYWQARRPSYAEALEAYHALNAQQSCIFLFQIADGAVTLLEKPAFDTTAESSRHASYLVGRARLYRDFLQRVVRWRRPRGSGVLAMSLEDRPYDYADFPIFAFEKPAGSTAVLLNDLDFMIFNFYARGLWVDQQAYAQKRAKAVFVGATTDSIHSETSVDALASPRLRAGVAFRGSDQVDFKLPVITQCETGAAEAKIRALGFGQGEYDWSYQLQNRFIISMDGNAATCSRVAIALKSRSALIRYESARELFYFPGLAPWLHYIPVASEQDVLDVVQMERDQPGRFQYVADEGRRFYRSFLNRGAVMSYAHQLMEMYFSLFQP